MRGLTCNLHVLLISMKRFGDDVHDKSLLKRPFGSSSGELNNQSQVRASDSGRRGGGSHRAGRDGADANASNIDFEQAISLVNKIKKHLGNDCDYKCFLDTLSMYRKEQKNVKEVYHEVAILLNDHPDLLDEFTKFLSNSTTNLDDNKTLMKLHKKQKKTCAEKGNKGKRTQDEDYKEPNNENKGDLSKQYVTDKMKYAGEVEDALKYVHGKEFTFCEKVKERVRSRAEYHAFLKCLHFYSREIITKEQLQSLVANILGKYPELMEGFNEFIERYERIVGFLAKWDEEEKDKEQIQTPPQRIMFEEAITFVKKVKERFKNDDDVYKSFLEILKMYNEEHNKSINEVYREIVVRLNDHPDLLDNFTKFLPDSSSLAMLKHYLDQLTILFSSL